MGKSTVVSISKIVPKQVSQPEEGKQSSSIPPVKDGENKEEQEKVQKNVQEKVQEKLQEKVQEKVAEKDNGAKKEDAGGKEENVDMKTTSEIEVEKSSSSKKEI